MAAAPAPPSVGSAAKVASEDGLTLNPGTLTVAQLQVRLWLFQGGCQGGCSRQEGCAQGGAALMRLA